MTVVFLTARRPVGPVARFAVFRECAIGTGGLCDVVTAEIDVLSVPRYDPDLVSSVGSFQAQTVYHCSWLIRAQSYTWQPLWRWGLL